MPTPSPLPDDASLRVHAVTDPERLYTLATDPARTARSWYDHEIVRLVVVLTGHHGQAATDWAVRLGEHAARQGDAPGARRLTRRIAWELVRRPGSAALRPHFEAPPERPDAPETEFHACLLQEMALRWGLREEPYLGYGTRLRTLGHPLAWLPLTSLYAEHAMRERAPLQGSMLGSLTPEELYDRYPGIPPTEAGAAAGRDAVPTPDEGRAATVEAPFAGFGAAEALFFALPRPLDPADFNASFLTSLRAPCLGGLVPDTLAAAHTTVDDAAGDLFVGAFSGGVWGDGGEQGAYARLLTWRALYALMDLDPAVPQSEAVRRAAEHRWLRLAARRGAGDRWFHGDLSDTAFAVLDPSRTRVAVVAATDTD
ncbi:DUF6183 family protein [Streptomyces sp. NPDC008121]|uniref:DUF6183 family protein n=1 Tax=Streptomyces sp. NPDC008121 TaxID=3364809 RepID=UPI0036ED4D69